MMRINALLSDIARENLAKFQKENNLNVDDALNKILEETINE